MIFGRRCWFIKTEQDQYRAAKVFIRVLHIIQMLLEPDLWCDRCTVQTAAALGVNTVCAVSETDVDSPDEGTTEAGRRLELNVRIQLRTSVFLSTVRYIVFTKSTPTTKRHLFHSS